MSDQPTKPAEGVQLPPDHIAAQHIARIIRERDDALERIADLMHAMKSRDAQLLEYHEEVNERGAKIVAALSALQEKDETIAQQGKTISILQECQANHSWWVNRAGELESALASEVSRHEATRRELTSVIERMQWKRVDQELPPVGKPVLCITMNFITHSQHYTAYRSEPMYEGGPVFWRDSHTGAQTIYATHWTPLLPAPSTPASETEGVE